MFGYPRSRILFSLLFLLLAGNVQAQNNLQGIYLVHAVTKIPVPDALVQSEDLRFNATADENGFVRLKGLSASTNKLLISRIGFETKLLDLLTLDTLNRSSIIYLESKASSLQEVTVAATSGTGVFAPISDLDIHLRPINNSQEVLRMVPGLFIGQHAGGGKSEQIFLRGFDIDHGTDINLSVDGIPVNMVSHAHGQGYADLHFIIPELIEKVNFNKGPYFADKGNFTTAGYVAFKTKDYLRQNFIKAEGGQFNTFRATTGINLLQNKDPRQKQSLYLAGEASFTRGFFDSPQDFNRYNGMLKYHGSITKRTTLTTMITAFRSRWNASGQIPLRSVADGTIGFYGAIDNTEGGHTSRYNASVSFLTNTTGGAVLRNQFYYSRYAFELYSNFTFFKEDTVNGDQIKQKESRNIIGYNGEWRKEFSIAGMRTETKVGGQLRFDAVDDIELTRTRSRSIVRSRIKLGDVAEVNAGIYWAQRLAVSNKLDVTAAIRADHFTNQYEDALSSATSASFSTIVSPKLNITYRLNNKVQLYLYNGKGFHSNDTRVAVQQNGKKVLPPAYGTDLGGILKIGDRLVVQTALWYLWLDQEFIYVGDEGVVEPGGRSKRVGFDISARYQIAANLFADVDLSLAKPRALNLPKEESYIPLAPRFTSVGGLTYRKDLGWNGSLRYRFMDDRPANEDASAIARGYLIADAAINYASQKWEAGVAIQNITNSRWKETQFYTESRLQNEPAPVSEIHFTPGTPFFARLTFSVFF